MAKTVKEAKADIFLRDTDSQSLFNNSGVLSFRYYHEWNDCYNPATDETVQINGEVYDETTNSYKPNCPEGFSPVFNGRLSALWDNIVNCFPNEVGAMYVKMRGNGLTYQDMLTKYKDFWKYWCENLYNADAFGYANTNNFTKAYGDKVQVMDYFYGKRQRYLDSKYHCGSSIGNNLRLRLYEVGRGFAIKHYQAIYCTLQWGAGNFDDYRNIKPGTYSYMPFKASSPQDVTFDIDDADLITELSTYVKGSDGNYTIYGLEGLGDFKFDLNMDLLKRLTKFVMNYTASRPNTREAGLNFDLSNMGMLRQVIVRNVKNLKKSIILSSDLLEEIDFTNTPITGVTTPPTDMLTKLVLPDTIKELNLVGYTNLQARYLQVAGYSNIETLHIEDCPNLDSYTICKACYDAGAKLSNVTLSGINWVISDIDFLLKLADKKASLKGKIDLSNVALSFSAKQSLLSAWGNIDDERNSLYIKYNKVNITTCSLGGINYFPKVGDYSLTVKTMPVTGNDFVSASWEISDNEFATINKDTGVISVEKIGNSIDNSHAEVKLMITLSDGTVLTASYTVYFYERDCELGDLVFSDGSYWNDLKPGLTPIGICFYIDPNNKTNRLMVGLKNYSEAGVWGLDDVTLPNITLKDSIENVYDVPYLENTLTFLNATDDNMVDNNGNFLSYPNTCSLGDIGFIKINDDIYQKLAYYLKDLRLEVGDFISYGQLKTLYIIRHRDVVLSDSSINRPIPRRNGNISEWNSLSFCISNIIAENNNNSSYASYYYVKTSKSYAYMPTVSDGETLNEKFTEHRWFLPSSGELARIMWYYTQNNNGKYDAIFKKYIGNLMTDFNSFLNYSSSSEANNKYAVGYNTTGRVDGRVDKGYSRGHLALVCAF